MEITLHNKMLLTEHDELHVDMSDKEENTVWITTKAGQFKVTGNGLVIFLGQDGEKHPGDIIYHGEAPEQSDAF